MNIVPQDGVNLQIDLLGLVLSVVTLGVVLMGFGLVVSGTAPQAGYRIKRLGLQAIGGALVVLAAHAFLNKIFGADIPLVLVICIYAVVALLLLQAALNLLFGPAVGNRVVASLLVGLITAIASLFAWPFRWIGPLFSRR